MPSFIHLFEQGICRNLTAHASAFDKHMSKAACPLAHHECPKLVDEALLELAVERVEQHHFLTIKPVAGSKCPDGRCRAVEPDR